jgi:thiamine biosynthesis lipoprotein
MAGFPRSTRVYSRRRAAAILAGAVAAPALADDPPRLERVTRSRRMMGVPWTITVFAPDREGAAAAKAALDEVARLDGVLSDYDPESELSRLSAAAPTKQPIPLSPDLGAVLARAVAIRTASGGAFDPTVGPLTTLWRQARRSGRMPLPDRLAAARAAVGPEALVVEGNPPTARLTRPGMRLDLGGIGMGYAIDRALSLLAGRGIAAALVDASGDIGASGPPPGADGWKVAVAALDPRQDGSETLRLTHAAVTTSGDAFQAVEIDGRRYSHIVDPRTGLGVPGPAAVTVIGPDAITADAVATAASVLGPVAGSAFVAGLAGCAARFVWQEEGRSRSSTTVGWPVRARRSPDGG